MNKKGFIKNFFTPELISIIRKSKFKIIILIITLLSSLVVIGIGNGAKNMWINEWKIHSLNLLI